MLFQKIKKKKRKTEEGESTLFFFFCSLDFLIFVGNVIAAIAAVCALLLEVSSAARWDGLSLCSSELLLLQKDAERE